jgi:choline dehydrogenase-like flavoprotein
VYPRDHTEEIFEVNGIEEVVLAAEAVYTPQILQLSEIRPKKVLGDAGIEVKLNLPGVGENFQDHPQRD